MKHSICLLAILYTLVSNGQPKPLLPGDSLPPEILQSILLVKPPHLSLSKDQSPASQLTTPDYRLQTPGSPLILLNFFATWCHSCIKRFPRLDSLQQQFAGNLRVVLMASTSIDDSTRIQNFFARHTRPGGGPWPFPVAAKDSLVKQLFPHRVLPHYVWIRHGKVLAITGSDAVTADNISAVLTGKTVAFPFKQDKEKELPTADSISEKYQQP